MTGDERRHPAGQAHGDHPDDALLQLAAEGLLDEDEQHRMERHIATCPACAATVQGYTELFGQLNAVPLVEAPVAVAETVMAAYRRRSDPIAAFWSDRKLLIAFALFIGVLLTIGITAIGIQGPLTLMKQWAIGLKDLLLSALQLVPVAEAIWTGMAHGGLLAVAALALLLITTVAALRQTLRLSEETT